MIAALRPAVGAACALLALFPASAGAVAYILYYHTFGDWAVVCWRGMVEGEKSCFIDGPPIEFNMNPFTSSIRIEPAGNAVQLTVSARSGTRTGTKVRLVVDGRTVKEGASNRIDHLDVTGSEAAAVIEDFRKGKVLLIELPAIKRRVRLSLIGFEEAYAAFEENLDRFVAPAEEPPPATGTAPNRVPAAPSAAEGGRN